MSHTVGAVARLAGVTVRTLHHYHEIGLLTPSGRSDAGYRRYGDADLDRLQRILFYRELGFGLDEIRTVMTDGGADAVVHLRRQHALLADRIGRLERMAAAVENAMEAHAMGISLTPEERFEVFGDFNPDDHAAEVEERWGETDAYRESARRTRGYTKQDWLRIRAESQAIGEAYLAAMRAASSGRQRRGNGRGRGRTAADQRRLLPVLAHDAREPGGDVHRRSALHRHVREDGDRDGAVRPRRDHRQRRPPGGLARRLGAGREHRERRRMTYGR